MASRLLSTIKVAVGTSTAAIALCLALPNASQAATFVDSELSLVIDSSGSIGTRNFNTQRDAYASVFNSPDTYNDIISRGSLGSIAVNLIQFGATAVEDIGWTVIDSVAASQSFAASISAITDGAGSSTNMTAALNLAANSFNSNDIESARQVIDISTDGGPNNRTTAATASQNAIASGVEVINVLGIGGGINEQYLQDNIARGSNADGNPAFVVIANTFDEVESTLRQKISREIAVIPDTPTPEPPIDPPTPQPPAQSVPEPASVLGILATAAAAASLRNRKKTEDLAEA